MLCGARRRLVRWKRASWPMLAVFDVEDYREIPYYFGVNKCWMTIKKGEILFRAERAALLHRG